jgi:hypothetical protein
LSDLKAKADREGNSETISWDAINQLGSRYGAPTIDWDRFKARFEPQNQNDPVAQADAQELRKLVSRYGSDGITLNTHNKEPKGHQGGEGESEVTKMAKSATKRALK